MRTHWPVFPGGCPHISLYVPSGNLVFALVPDGLCYGFWWVGVCRPVAPVTGPGKTSVFFKGISEAAVTLRMRKRYCLLLGNCR